MAECFMEYLTHLDPDTKDLRDLDEHSELLSEDTPWGRFSNTSLKYVLYPNELY